MKKNKFLGIMLILVMVIALALTGCGQKEEPNAGATGSGESTVDSSHNTSQDDGNDSSQGVNNMEPKKNSDGYYIYEVGGQEILCETNIWDYIDGDVWQRTEMFEDLGYGRDESIPIPSKEVGFFRYSSDTRLTAYVGRNQNQSSDDFINEDYLNELFIRNTEGDSFWIIIRYEQESFATDEAGRPETPLDLIILSACVLENCQSNVDESALRDLFPASSGQVWRIWD